MTEKYKIEQKIEITIKSLSATNIAEPCLRTGIFVVRLNKFKEKIIYSGCRALCESSRGTHT